VLQGREDWDVREEDRVFTLGVCAHARAAEACLVHGNVFGGWGHCEADIAVRDPS
jgi:hypothetical protein